MKCLHLNNPQITKIAMTIMVMAAIPVNSEVQAQILDDTSRQISFQARLTDAGGNPVSDGAHVLDFHFYDGPAAVPALDSILNVNVLTTNGVAAVSIGPVNGSIFDGTERWMGITVDDVDDDPAGNELSPRISFGAVPHAFRVDRVENEELTDHVELGMPSTAGSIIVHADEEEHAIALDGSHRAIVLFDDTGAERITLDGAEGTASINALRIAGLTGMSPMTVRRQGQANTDLIINSQGQVAIGSPAGTLAKLTVNGEGEEPLRVRLDDITRFVVAADGQVGVNTSVPAAQLQVNGASGEDIMEVRRFGTATPTFRINAAGEIIVGEENGVNALLTINAPPGDDAFRIRTDGVTRLMVAQDGQVGVGTSIPTAKLHINAVSGENPLEVRSFGTTTPALRVTDTGDVIVGDETGTNTKLTVNADGEDAFRVRTDGATRFMVAQDGQVGVGTSVPTAKLQINAVSGENPLEVRSFGTSIPALRVADTGDVIVGDETGTNAKLTVNADSEDAIRVRTDGITRLFVAQDGEVGIGTASPLARLHVSGSENNGNTSALRVTSGTQNMLFDGNEIDTLGGSMFVNNNSDEDVILVNNGGAVGIGTTNIPADSLLAVDGKVMCEEVEVQNSANWPDYVFADDYPLMSLDDLENHIDRNRHLPGFPSASEMDAAGSIRLGDMQTKTIEKVEELTLYVLQLNRRLESLEQENRNLRDRLNTNIETNRP